MLKNWGNYIYYPFSYPKAEDLPGSGDYYSMVDFSDSLNKMPGYILVEKILGAIMGGEGLTSFHAGKYVEAFASFSMSNYVQRMLFGVKDQVYRQP